MKSSSARKFNSFLLFVFMPLIVIGQEGEDVADSLRKDAVRIFIDCQHCDMNYIRNEIPYVNYVRDVREAQLYILETRQSTGSGGMEYTFVFHGQQNFTGLNDTLVYVCRPDDTDDNIRRGRTDMLKMGLMRYVARTPIYRQIQISHRGRGTEQEVVDRWNNWVFELATYPGFEGEESVKEFSFDNALRVSKVTKDWKLDFNLQQEMRNNKYHFEDTTYKANRNSLMMENLLVKSLNDHWSAGLRFNLVSSSFSNIKFGYDAFPSVEYDIYPYSQSTRKQLRILYGIGFNHFSYKDTTIYYKLRENLFSHQLELAYQVQEKWGSINIAMIASNFLRDFKKNRLQVEGHINIRIVKGLSFQVFGDAARIRDQLSLVKGDLKQEEVLLQIRELATDYNFDFGFGFTYTFGSIYNNIVNPRFGSGNSDMFD
jgi:hypothetical protein